MEQINYEQLIPTEPASDVVRFARENGEFQGNYLIYRFERVCIPLEDRTREMVQVICTGCGETFYAEKIKAGGCGHSAAPAPFGWQNWDPKDAVISGQHTLCPCCGAEAETVHVGRMGLYHGEMVEDTWVSELSQLPAEGGRDRLALTDWCVRRCIDKQGRVRYEVWPYTAWVVEEKKIVRLMGYRKYMGGVSLLGRWEQRKTFCDVYGTARHILPWDEKLLEGTTGENCKLDLYQKAGGRHLVAYLALWRRHPAVENLVVQGCGELVDAWIRKETETYVYRGGCPVLRQVNWKEKRPSQMLGLTKEEFRQMKRGRWSAEDLEVYRLVRDAGGMVRLPDDMELLKSTPAYTCNRILNEAPKADLWRILRYLKKQRSDWSTLRDYWRMAAEDGRDVDDSLVRWPRDLEASHARQIRERQERREREQAEKRAKRMAERASLFRARTAALDKLSFQLDGLLIRPCSDEDELIAEGRALHHCVASYAEGHASGKTAILFIRRAEEPDKPYFTLEFDEKRLTVRQNRGLRNCARTPEVEAFEKAWLEWVKASKGKKARVRAA